MVGIFRSSLQRLPCTEQLLFVGFSSFRTAWTRLGPGMMPFLVNSAPKKTPSSISNWHFSKLSVIPAPCTACRAKLSHSSCSCREVPHISTSFMYTWTPCNPSRHLETSHAETPRVQTPIQTVPSKIGIAQMG